MPASAMIRRTFWSIFSVAFCVMVMSSCAKDEVQGTKLLGSLNTEEPPVRATVEQNGETHILKERVYTLQGTTIKFETGGIIKSDQIIYDGRTGTFEAGRISGRILPSVIELRAPRGKYNMGGDNARGTSIEAVMHNGYFSTGRIKIEADKIHVIWL